MRGLCIILMVLDHFFLAARFFMPNIWIRFEVPPCPYYGTAPWSGLRETANWWWTQCPLRPRVRAVVLVLFCTLCGISCTLSKSNLKRGLAAAFVAGGITLVTHLGQTILEIPMAIYFGVIHMYAAAILIYCALDAVSVLIGGREYRNIRMSEFKESMSKGPIINLFKRICERIKKPKSTETEEEIEAIEPEKSNKAFSHIAAPEESKKIKADFVFGKPAKMDKAIYLKPVNLTRIWLAKLFPAMIGVVFVFLFFNLWGQFNVAVIGGGDIISTLDRYFEEGTLRNFMSMLMYLPRGQTSALSAGEDYFPVLPWAIFVLLGTLLGQIFYKSGFRTWIGMAIAGLFKAKIHRVFRGTRAGIHWSVGMAGRKTLWIYVLHQPLFIAFFALAAFFFR